MPVKDVHAPDQSLEMRWSRVRRVGVGAVAGEFGATPSEAMRTVKHRTIETRAHEL